ncbi:MAG: 23S rRNA (pseudouridine(1915)-N(3))-methyltransferase RlmH, partial [Bacteroidales bacterium]|nr:23S rRNA (pseudouridine(1915)-N(3))-methyltransferase RlmH [Bacteroidales bacterium]
MTIRLIVVGKTEASYLQEGISEYVARLKHYVRFEMEVIPALKDQKNASPDEVKEREAQLILRKLDGCDRIVLLDEHGTERTSMDFARYVQKQMNAGTRTLAFVVGGAFGFAPSIYAAAHDKMSISRMTLTHQMVRLFFVEQLYRAFTILKGEK